MADLIRRALDMKVEQALGRVRQAEAKYDKAMTHVDELQRDLREFHARIDAEAVRLAAFAKSSMHGR